MSDKYFMNPKEFLNLPREIQETSSIAVDSISNNIEEVMRLFSPHCRIQASIYEIMIIGFCDEHPARILNFSKIEGEEIENALESITGRINLINHHIKSNFCEKEKDNVDLESIEELFTDSSIQRFDQKFKNPNSTNEIKKLLSEIQDTDASMMKIYKSLIQIAISFFDEIKFTDETVVIHELNNIFVKTSGKNIEIKDLRRRFIKLGKACHEKQFNIQCGKTMLKICQDFVLTWLILKNLKAFYLLRVDFLIQKELTSDIIKKVSDAKISASLDGALFFYLTNQDKEQFLNALKLEMERFQILKSNLITAQINYKNYFENLPSTIDSMLQYQIFNNIGPLQNFLYAIGTNDDSKNKLIPKFNEIILKKIFKSDPKDNFDTDSYLNSIEVEELNSNLDSLLKPFLDHSANMLKDEDKKDIHSDNDDNCPLDIIDSDLVTESLESIKKMRKLATENMTDFCKKKSVLTSAIENLKNQFLNYDKLLMSKNSIPEDIKNVMKQKREDYFSIPQIHGLSYPELSLQSIATSLLEKIRQHERTLENEENRKSKKIDSSLGKIRFTRFFGDKRKYFNWIFRHKLESKNMNSHDLFLRIGDFLSRDVLYQVENCRTYEEVLSDLVRIYGSGVNEISLLTEDLRKIQKPQSPREIRAFYTKIKNIRAKLSLLDAENQIDKFLILGIINNTAPKNLQKRFLEKISEIEEDLINKIFNSKDNTDTIEILKDKQITGDRNLTIEDSRIIGVFWESIEKELILNRKQLEGRRERSDYDKSFRGRSRDRKSYRRRSKSFGRHMDAIERSGSRKTRNFNRSSSRRGDSKKFYRNNSKNYRNRSQSNYRSKSRNNYRNRSQSNYRSKSRNNSSPRTKKSYGKRFYKHKEKSRNSSRNESECQYCKYLKKSCSHAIFRCHLLKGEKNKPSYSLKNVLETLRKAEIHPRCLNYKCDRSCNGTYINASKEKIQTDCRIHESYRDPHHKILCSTPSKNNPSTLRPSSINYTEKSDAEDKDDTKQELTDNEDDISEYYTTENEEDSSQSDDEEFDFLSVNNKDKDDSASDYSEADEYYPDTKNLELSYISVNENDKFNQEDTSENSHSDHSNEDCSTVEEFDDLNSFESTFFSDDEEYYESEDETYDENEIWKYENGTWVEINEDETDTTIKNNSKYIEGHDPFLRCPIKLCSRPYGSLKPLMDHIYEIHNDVMNENDENSEDDENDENFDQNENNEYDDNYEINRDDENNDNNENIDIITEYLRVHTPIDCNVAYDLEMRNPNQLRNLAIGIVNAYNERNFLIHYFFNKNFSIIWSIQYINKFSAFRENLHQLKLSHTRDPNPPEIEETIQAIRIMRSEQNLSYLHNIQTIRLENFSTIPHEKDYDINVIKHFKFHGENDGINFGLEVDQHLNSYNFNYHFLKMEIPGLLMRDFDIIHDRENFRKLAHMISNAKHKDKIMKQFLDTILAPNFMKQRVYKKFHIHRKQIDDVNESNDETDSEDDGDDTDSENNDDYDDDNNDSEDNDDNDNDNSNDDKDNNDMNDEYDSDFTSDETDLDDYLDNLHQQITDQKNDNDYNVDKDFKQFIDDYLINIGSPDELIYDYRENWNEILHFFITKFPKILPDIEFNLITLKNLSHSIVQSSDEVKTLTNFLTDYGVSSFTIKILTNKFEGYRRYVYDFLMNITGDENYDDDHEKSTEISIINYFNDNFLDVINLKCIFNPILTEVKNLILSTYPSIYLITLIPIFLNYLLKKYNLNTMDFTSNNFQSIISNNFTNNSVDLIESFSFKLIRCIAHAYCTYKNARVCEDDISYNLFAINSSACDIVETGNDRDKEIRTRDQPKIKGSIQKKSDENSSNLDHKSGSKKLILARNKFKPKISKKDINEISSSFLEPVNKLGHNSRLLERIRVSKDPNGPTTTLLVLYDAGADISALSKKLCDRLKPKIYKSVNQRISSIHGKTSVTKNYEIFIKTHKKSFLSLIVTAITGLDRKFPPHFLAIPKLLSNELKLDKNHFFYKRDRLKLIIGSDATKIMPRQYTNISDKLQKLLDYHNLVLYKSRITKKFLILGAEKKFTKTPNLTKKDFNHFNILQKIYENLENKDFTKKLINDIPYKKKRVRFSKKIKKFYPKKLKFKKHKNTQSPKNFLKASLKRDLNQTWSESDYVGNRDQTDRVISLNDDVDYIHKDSDRMYTSGQTKTIYKTTKQDISTSGHKREDTLPISYVVRPASFGQDSTEQDISNLFYCPADSPKYPKKSMKRDLNDIYKRDFGQDIKSNLDIHLTEKDNNGPKSPAAGHIEQDISNFNDPKLSKNERKMSQICTFHTFLDNLSTEQNSLNFYKINQTERDFFNEHSVMFDKKSLKQFCERCTRCNSCNNNLKMTDLEKAEFALIMKTVIWQSKERRFMVHPIFLDKLLKILPSNYVPARKSSERLDKRVSRLEKKVRDEFNKILTKNLSDGIFQLAKKQRHLDNLQTHCILVNIAIKLKSQTHKCRFTMNGSFSPNVNTPSLNDVILSGPNRIDLTSTLLFTRSRQYFASVDLERAYHLMYLNPKMESLCRVILKVKKNKETNKFESCFGEKEGELLEFSTKRVSYGLKMAGSYLLATLLKAGESFFNNSEIDTECFNCLKASYVDNIFIISQTLPKLNQLKERMSAFFKHFNIKTHPWSHSIQINQELIENEISIENCLGMDYNNRSDEFQMKLKFDLSTKTRGLSLRKPLQSDEDAQLYLDKLDFTRRSALKCSASLYDLTGFYLSCQTTLRLLFRKVILSSKDNSWESTVDAGVKKEYAILLNHLSKINVSFPRYIYGWEENDNDNTLFCTKTKDFKDSDPKEPKKDDFSKKRGIFSSKTSGFKDPPFSPNPNINTSVKMFKVKNPTGNEVNKNQKTLKITKKEVKNDKLTRLTRPKTQEFIPSLENKKFLPALCFFSDGSDLASSTKCFVVSYCHKLKRNKVSLICGRSNILPLKRNLSVIELELNGLYLAVKICDFIENYTNITFKSQYFFIDSFAVYLMCNSQAEMYQKYAGNKIRTILSYKTASQIHWIESHENLADKSSRYDLRPTAKSLMDENANSFLESDFNDWHLNRIPENFRKFRIPHLLYIYNSMPLQLYEQLNNLAKVKNTSGSYTLKQGQKSSKNNIPDEKDTKLEKNSNYKNGSKNDPKKGVKGVKIKNPGRTKENPDRKISRTKQDISVLTGSSDSRDETIIDEHYIYIICSRAHTNDYLQTGSDILMTNLKNEPYIHNELLLTNYDLFDLNVKEDDENSAYFPNEPSFREVHALYKGKTIVNHIKPSYSQKHSIRKRKFEGRVDLSLARFMKECEALDFSKDVEEYSNLLLKYRKYEKVKRILSRVFYWSKKVLSRVKKTKFEKSPIHFLEEVNTMLKKQACLKTGIFLKKSKLKYHCYVINGLIFIQNRLFLPSEKENITPPASLILSPSTALAQIILVNEHFKAFNHNKLSSQITGKLRLQTESILIPRSNVILDELTRKCKFCIFLRKETVIPNMGNAPSSVLNSSQLGKSFVCDLIGPITCYNNRKYSKIYYFLAIDVFTGYADAIFLPSRKLNDMKLALKSLKRKFPVKQIFFDRESAMLSLKQSNDEVNLNRKNASEVTSDNNLDINENKEVMDTAIKALQQIGFENNIEIKINPGRSSHKTGRAEKLVDHLKSIFAVLSSSFEIEKLSKNGEKILRTSFFIQNEKLSSHELTQIVKDLISIINDRPVFYNDHITYSRTDMIFPHLRGNINFADDTFSNKNSFLEGHGRVLKTVQILAEKHRFLIASRLLKKNLWLNPSKELTPGDLVILTGKPNKFGHPQIGKVTKILDDDFPVRNFEITLSHSYRSLKNGKLLTKSNIVTRNSNNLIFLCHENSKDPLEFIIENYEKNPHKKMSDVTNKNESEVTNKNGESEVINKNLMRKNLTKVKLITPGQKKLSTIYNRFEIDRRGDCLFESVIDSIHRNEGIVLSRSQLNDRSILLRRNSLECALNCLKHPEFAKIFKTDNQNILKEIKDALHFLLTPGRWTLDLSSYPNAQFIENLMVHFVSEHLNQIVVIFRESKPKLIIVKGFTEEKGLNFNKKAIPIFLKNDHYSSLKFQDKYQVILTRLPSLLIDKKYFNEEKEAIEFIEDIYGESLSTTT